MATLWEMSPQTAVTDTGTSGVCHLTVFYKESHAAQAT